MIIGSLGVRDRRCLQPTLFILYLMQSLAHLGTTYLLVKWYMEGCSKNQKPTREVAYLLVSLISWFSWFFWMMVLGYRGTGGSQRATPLGVSSFLPRDPRTELRPSQKSANTSAHWVISPDFLWWPYVRDCSNPSQNGWLSSPGGVALASGPVTQAATGCWVPCAFYGHLCKDCTLLWE